MCALEMATELSRRLGKALGSSLVRVVLFGSTARGDREPGSDIDILVVVRDRVERARELVPEIALQLAEERCWPAWPELLVLSMDEYNRMAREGRYIINALAEEGLVLYDDGSGELEDPSPGPSEAELEEHLARALSLIMSAVRDVEEQDRGLLLRGYESAFARAFEAVENLVRALVKSQGYQRLPRRHGGWLTLFARDFVRPGAVPQELWEAVSAMARRRPEITYGVARAGREEALQALKTALELFRLAVELLAEAGLLEPSKRDGYLRAAEGVRLPA